MDIHRSSIKDFILPKVKSVYVIDYYEGIKGILSSINDFPYKDFLANPRLRTQTEIVWASEAFSNKPRLLEDLDGILKERYGYVLKECICSIESIIRTLEDEGSVDIAELLAKSISYIDEGSVYCADGNVVVVNWGLIPRKKGLDGGGIYRSGRFIGAWENLYKQQTEELVLDGRPIGRETTSEIDVISKSVINEKSLTDHQTLQHYSKPTSDISDGLDNKNEDIECSKQKDIPIDRDFDELSTTKSLQSETSIEENHDNRRTLEKIETDYIPNRDSQNHEVYSWKTLFKSFITGLRFILRKLWWLFLFLLLAVLAMYLGRDYQGYINQLNPFYSPLPKTPVVLPVDKNAVGLSEDGMVQIATDRLNVLLEKTNDNTMLDWARAFKKAYSGSEYEIYYYNEEFYNLQIKVPSEQREQIKKEIHEKLKGFTFEVFDETVYQSDFISFNDPELTNQNHSWYLSAINAFEAWSFTLGDPDIIVAVVDNGFDINHPEFSGKIVHPYNVLSHNSNLRPIITKNGEDAHGTHVASTAVGNCNNGTGLMGIAPNCKLMPVQVGSDHPDGTMSNQAIMEGVMYAINQGADVINVSLGMYTPEEVKRMSEGQQLNYISCNLKNEELMWNKIFEKARQRNSIVVFAAGNDNVVAGIDPKKRSMATIKVSAVDISLGKANFSNYGRYEQLDREYSSLSAPGVGIYSAAPHGKYVSMQGTSMAAPIVSGAVALLKSANRNLTTDQVIALLKETGREISPNIGPLINLGNALKEVFNGVPTTDCEDIVRQIDRLKAQIDSLTQLCPYANMPADTLKYKDAIKDNHGMDGLWKTTTSLVASGDNTPIELYMEFKNLIGTLSIKNQGNLYTAPLTAKIENGKIKILQYKDATCPNSQTRFLKYTYICNSDSKGNLICKATNPTGSVTFNLIRVK